MAWALAASRQSRTHSLAEDCMTPPPRLPGDRDRNLSGRPRTAGRSGRSNYRRRINTEDKAKVVAAGWGTFLNAALTI